MSAEKKLSLDLLPGDELLISGEARVSIVRRAGKRTRVQVKAKENVTVSRVVSEDK